MSKARVHVDIFQKNELSWQSTRSRGPGGQNVNRTESAILLRWAIDEAQWLTDEERARLVSKLQNRLTQENEIIIRAEEFRDQERNRQAALQRLVDLLNEALHVAKARKKTKPSFSSQKKRVHKKRARSQIKKDRKVHSGDWD